MRKSDGAEDKGWTSNYGCPASVMMQFAVDIFWQHQSVRNDALVREEGERRARDVAPVDKY